MIEYIPQLKQGNLPGYTPGDIPQSSNLMSTEEGKCFFFHLVVPENSEK